MMGVSGRLVSASTLVLLAVFYLTVECVPHGMTGASVASGQEEGGVLQGLWSGLGAMMGLGGRNVVETRLERFLHEGLDEVEKQVKELSSRHRRAHPLNTPITRDNTGVYRLAGVEDVAMPVGIPEGASVIVVEQAGWVLWLTTETFTQSHPGSLVVYGYRPGEQPQKVSIATRGATKCVPVLREKSFLEVACVEPYGELAEEKVKRGSGVYRVGWDGDLSLTFHRALDTRGAQDITTWDFRGQTYLAFANSYDREEGRGETSSVVFRQQVTRAEGQVITNYDPVDSAAFPTKNALGVAAFTIVSRIFLAVANHKDDQGNVDIHSEIFVYEVETESLRSYQRIRTSAARDWVAFSFLKGPSAEYFLAVANEYQLEGGHKNYEVDSVIYKFDDKFIPFQCVRTFGAREWLVHQGPRGEFLLAVVNNQAGVFFYQYNGWRFVRSNFKASGPGVERAWITFLPQTLQQTVLFVATPLLAAPPRLYHITFQHINPLARYHTQSLDWCRSLSAGLDDGLHTLVSKLESAPKIDENHAFTSLTIEGNLILKPEAKVSKVGEIWVRGEGYRVDHNFTNVSTQIEGLNEAIARLASSRQVLAASRKTDGPHLDGLDFTEVAFRCERGGSVTCLVQDLHVRQINGRDSNIDDALRIDQSVRVSSINLAQVEVRTGTKTEVQVLSGNTTPFPQTPVSQLVTLTGTHNILAEKDFEIIRIDDMDVSGTVDSVHISRTNLLLTTGDQEVTVDGWVESLVTTGMTLATLNGRDLTSVVDSLVLNNTSQHLAGTFIVMGDVMGDEVTTTQLVSPLDPQSLVEKALFHTTEQTQVVTERHTLQDVGVLSGDLRVEGQVNGVNVPEDLYLTSRPEHFTAPVTFTSLQAQTVVVRSWLGGVQVRDGELDVVVMTGGEQVVSGRKLFHGIALLADSLVTLTVAGYRLQDLQASALATFLDGVNSGRKVGGWVKFVEELNLAGGEVDEVSVSNILDNALPLDTRTISATFIFQSEVEILGDAQITATLNGRRPGEYVLIDDSHVFTHNVTFTADLKTERDLEVETVNGIPLGQQSAQIVTMDGPQTVTEDLHVQYLSLAADLTVGGHVEVAGVGLDTVVRRDATVDITGTKTFSMVRVTTEVAAGDVQVAGSVDGVMLQDLFFGDSLRKTGGGGQQLVGRELNTLVVSSVNGTELARLVAGVVLPDTTLLRHSGSLTFTGHVRVQDLTFGDHFDGVSAEQFESGWLLRTGRQTLTGATVMRQGMSAGQVTTATGAHIQGVDLARMVRHAAKIDQATILHLIAFGKLISSQGVAVDGRIQGWKLSEEAMTSDAPFQTVSGNKVFTSAVHYTDEFWLDDVVLVRSGQNDDSVLPVDVGMLCSTPQTLTPTHLHTLVLERAASFEGNLTVSGNLNGEDVGTLLTVFWLADVAANVSSVTSFTDVRISQGHGGLAEVLGTINGLSLVELWEGGRQSKCEEALIVTEEMHLEAITTHSLTTETLANLNDDLGLTDLKDALLKDGDQEITGHLNLIKVETSEVLLFGTLNGLNVATDMVHIGQFAVITGSKMFTDDLHITGDLAMVDGATVQGVDVSELWLVSVLREDGRQVFTVPGLTTFASLVYTGPELRVDGVVDGVRLDAVLLKTGQQVVVGSVLVKAVVEVGLEATRIIVEDGHLNGFSLVRLTDMTVRKDLAVTVQHTVIFPGVCHFRSVVLAAGLLNGHDLSALAVVVRGRFLVETGEHFGAVLQAAQDTREILAENNTDIWYFEETPIKTVHKLLAITLVSEVGDPREVDTLVGLDRRLDQVNTYSLSQGYPRLYPGVSVKEPVAGAGLGGGLLATCGRASSTPAPLTPTIVTIPARGGSSHGYGHIHFVSAGGSSIMAAFGITDCRHLVSVRLPNGRVCVAVVEYAGWSSVICGSTQAPFSLLNYLNTTRATQGGWLELGGDSYLLVVEEETDWESGTLKIFQYDSLRDEMILARRVEVGGAWDMDVVEESYGGAAVVAITTRSSRLCNSTVAVYRLRTDLSVESLQRLEVFEGVESSLVAAATGEVMLFVQTRRGLLIYSLKGDKFTFVRKILTTPCLHPSSSAFAPGDGRTLLVAFAGLGWLDGSHPQDSLDLVPSRVYRAVYRGTSSLSLYRAN